ncbi:hypothetical protein POM88_030512 [Heracleum sosnowskyi]|uniref:Uncharacterized protein n=1 Tax=Heracleum sosnowskyi TaxID=360622 RepID=A0AAD8HVN9_9APIA|nr:hypothetical protein POM88_030512 [Heracleum sosnowskyi]
MKRTKDNLGVSSAPFKKRGYSRGESGQAQAAAGGNKADGGGVATGSVRRRVTIDDALSFTMKVKQTFEAQRERYEAYLDVLKDYEEQRIGIPVVVARVKELLKGHDGLLAEFRFFMPDRYQGLLM